MSAFHQILSSFAAFVTAMVAKVLVLLPAWSARDSNRQWYSIASSADGTKLAAVGVGGQIYTSADSGVTWTARENSRLWRAIASSADGTKLAAVVLGGQIYTADFYIKSN